MVAGIEIRRPCIGTEHFAGRVHDEQLGRLRIIVAAIQAKDVCAAVVVREAAVDGRAVDRDLVDTLPEALPGDLSLLIKEVSEDGRMEAHPSTFGFFARRTRTE
jgi:hypothetical protein